MNVDYNYVRLNDDVESNTCLKKCCRITTHYMIVLILAASELFFTIAGVIILGRNISYFNSQLYSYILSQTMLLCGGGIGHACDKHVTGYTLVGLILNLILSVWGMTIYYKYDNEDKYNAELWNYLYAITTYFIILFSLIGFGLIYLCIYGTE
jgi:hypothetical protein